MVAFTNRQLRHCRILVLILLAITLGSGRTQAQTAAVVMSSDLPPYLEALAEFQSSFNRPIHRLDAGDAIPDGVQVAVAIGGKAALQPYPAGVMLCVR